MPVKVNLEGARGRGNVAHVGDYGALWVSQQIPEIKPPNTPNRYRFFQKRLGSTGFGSGTLNMNVNGAVTPQTFYGESHPDYDIYITDVTIIIADTAVQHNDFGNVGALANGWDLIATESGENTYLIEKAKTGGQVIARSGFYNPYGDGVLGWELSNWTGGSDVQAISMPLSKFIPGGLRLGRGTFDRITSVVNDDLTGLTEFYVRCFGYKHLP